MKTTDESKLLQNARPRAILFGCLATALILNATSAARAQYTKHSEFQAVGDDGDTTSTLDMPQTFIGVVLNNPEDMLNGEANYLPWLEDKSNMWKMGGQWQVFIQSVETDDWGGTALWMGQNYGNLPWIRDSGRSYQDADWESELERLNDPEDDDNPFRAGDLIEVYARGSKFYAGKRNVNEEHWNTPDKDFDITILQRGYGLPTPTTINISNVKYAPPSDDYIFNATDPAPSDGIPLDYDDVAGCEKYQAQLVTLLNVQLAEVQEDEWGAGAMIKLTDATGSEFPMHLGLDEYFDTMTAPEGTFNVTGIFNQEADVTDMDGYELWVMNHEDFDELVLGDLDGSHLVGAGDLAIIQANWGQYVTTPGNWLSGDPSGDGFVGAADLAIVQANWGNHAPEPSTLVSALIGLLILGGLAIRRRALCKKWKFGLAVVLVAMTAGSASAATTLGFPEVGGYITQDMELHTDTDWLNSELLITLTSGSIYQDDEGSNFQPDPSDFDDRPSLEFDSYVADGKYPSDITLSIVGGAVDLGGDPIAQFDEYGINVTWYTMADDDIGDLVLARITLSTNAEGTWAARTQNLGGDVICAGGPITGGRMVPEPGTLAMLILGGLWFVGYYCYRKRRTRS